MKIAFVVGHHEKAKGANSPHFNKKEWDFYNEVLSYIDKANVFYHDSEIGGYVTRIKDTASRLNKENFDLVVCLHFNASRNHTATGCETLYYYRSGKGKAYVAKFSEVVHDWTGLRNRGVRALMNVQDRGFAAVYYPKAPTILIEPFFGDNKNDCKKIKSAQEMACIIKDFLSKL